jgi:hypothetical protein
MLIFGLNNFANLIPHNSIIYCDSPGGMEKSSGPNNNPWIMGQVGCGE